MVENSIEEIRFVENEIKNTRRSFEEVGCYAFFDEDLCKSLEHILSDYKRVLKENEELKNKLSLKQFDINVVYNDYLEKLNEYKENSIPKQKVKEKIEELDKKVKDYQCIENRINLYQRKVLQELLKESEE